VIERDKEDELMIDWRTRWKQETRNLFIHTLYVIHTFRQLLS